MKRKKNDTVETEKKFKTGLKFQTVFSQASLDSASLVDSVAYLRLSKIIYPLTIEPVVKTPLPQLMETLDWIKKSYDRFSAVQFNAIQLYGFFLWRYAEVWNHAPQDYQIFSSYWGDFESKDFPQRRQFCLQILELLFLKRNKFTPWACHLERLLEVIDSLRAKNNEENENIPHKAKDIKLAAMSMAASELKFDLVNEVEIRKYIKPVSELAKSRFFPHSFPNAKIEELSWYTKSFPQGYGEKDVEDIIGFLSEISNYSTQREPMTAAFLQALINLKQIRPSYEILLHLLTILPKLHLPEYEKELFLKNYEPLFTKKSETRTCLLQTEKKDDKASQIPSKFSGKTAFGLGFLLCDFLSMKEISTLAQTAQFLHAQIYAWDQNNLDRLNHFYSFVQSEQPLMALINHSFLILKNIVNWIDKRIHRMDILQCLRLQKWQMFLWENTELWTKDLDPRLKGLQFIKLAFELKTPVGELESYFLSTMLTQLEKHWPDKQDAIHAKRSLLTSLERTIPESKLESFLRLTRLEDFERILILTEVSPRDFRKKIAEAVMSKFFEVINNSDLDRVYGLTRLLLEYFNADRLPPPALRPQFFVENLETIISRVSVKKQEALKSQRDELLAKYNRVSISETLTHTGSPLIAQLRSNDMLPLKRVAYNLSSE